jgi:hypothetical protein
MFVKISSTIKSKYCFYVNAGKKDQLGSEIRSIAKKLTNVCVFFFGFAGMLSTFYLRTYACVGTYFIRQDAPHAFVNRV